MKRKKEEREKRKLEKMRTLGADYMMHERKRKLKKKLRKRKAEMVMQASDDEKDLDYEGNKEKRKKERRREKKPKKGDAANKEFSQFSSGSDGTGLEDESDLEELYQEIAVIINCDRFFVCSC